MDSTFLLDTCTLLWLSADRSQLSQSAREILESPESNLAVSSISALEVALKHQKKKLELAEAPLQWFQDLLQYHQIKEIIPDAKIFIRSSELPFVHKDPFDRILLATAQIHNLTILSPDKHLNQYPEIQICW